MVKSCITLGVLCFAIVASEAFIEPTPGKPVSNEQLASIWGMGCRAYGNGVTIYCSGTCGSESHSTVVSTDEVGNKSAGVMCKDKSNCTYGGLDDNSDQCNNS